MELLSKLAGKKVTVYSLQGGAERQDVGTLTEVDLPFFRIVKADGEVLYFSVHLVRLVKPF